MCGISGICAGRITEQHEQLVDDILKSQTARGPDHAGKVIWQGTTASIIFGHNRLSIIDLSERAEQPMWDASGRWCITYNGEIYNYIELRRELRDAGYRFRTESDTEVILNAFACWGPEALERFAGPFAFAIFDTGKQTLWLCRDRFGVRPLFWKLANNTLYFASSTAVLAKAFGSEPDLAYVARGLATLVYEDGSDATPYQGIHLVPAGSFLQAAVDLKGALSPHLTRYYDLAQRIRILAETLPLDNPKSLLEQVARRFEDAVRFRLRADVPVAVTLSSGVDSSSVAAVARQFQNQVTGFSYGSPEHSRSEGPLVSLCAKYLDIKMIHIWPTIPEMIDGLFKTITAQDAPFSGPGVVAQYLLYKKISENNIRVVLGGQGGDEAFMGYRKFVLFWQRQLFREKRYLHFIKNMLQFMPTLISERTSFKTYWQHLKRYRRPPASDSVLDLPAVSLPDLGDHSGDVCYRQVQDVLQFSLPTLLRYEDRNGMGNSVESRLPFLDHNMIECGIALPVALKIRKGYGKWPVRQMMAGKLPDQIRLARFKRGFDVPLVSLLQAGLGVAIRRVLQENRSNIQNYLKSGIKIEKAFSDREFMHRKSAMAESIALLWLGRAF